MISGLAVIDGLEDVLAYHGCRPLDADRTRTGSDLALKWPNDIFCGGCKLAGILCELVTVDQEWSAVIIGVGMNLFLPEDHLPTDLATSLHLRYGQLPEYGMLRDDLVDAISWYLSLYLNDLVDRADPALDDLRSRIGGMSWTVGRQVEVRPVAGDPVRGKALAINPDASLKVELEDGSSITVTTGDVGVLPDVSSGTR